MKRLLFFFLFSPLFLYAQNINILDIDDHIISPVTEEYIQRGLEISEKENAILLIRLDTPGGLLKSTQHIVKMLLNAPVPVITYIAPAGAKAASAGVFIGYASDVLAMSPSTHIGSAHPVIGMKSWGNLPEELKNKVLNDTLAWAANIASQKNRPLDFIVRAVKESISITEQEALKREVCDIIAVDQPALIAALNGRQIEIKGKTRTLATEKAGIKLLPLTGKERFLNTLIEPNIAYLLLTLGFLALIFEVTHPGFGFPGIAGMICLILAFYALSILPVNYAGIALIVLGISFFLAEAFTPAFGMFTAGGITALVLGTLMMYNQPDLITVSCRIFLPLIVFFGLLSSFLLTKIISSQRQKAKTGRESLINSFGVAQSDINPRGKVFVHSELWNAVSSRPIKKGEKIIVEEVKGLTLYVKKEG